MKERPILFSAPMVRAILEGRKTQTRRIIKSPSVKHPELVLLAHDDVNSAWWPFYSDDGESSVTDDGMEEPIECPHGKPGDRLWVRETWMEPFNDPERFRYRATNPSYADKWRPSIFMPRTASRITLTISSVRCERVQEISAADAVAEGLEKNHNGYWWGGAHAESGRKQHADPRISYKELWDHINAKRAPWASNPWVWVIKFNRVAS